MQNMSNFVQHEWFSDVGFTAVLIYLMITLHSIYTVWIISALSAFVSVFLLTVLLHFQDDRKLNEEKKPAIHKLNFLSHIMLQLKK